MKLGDFIYPAVRAEQDAQRVVLGTSRVAHDGFGEVLVPDFTRAMAADLRYLETEAVEPDPADFSPFLQPGTESWHDFFEGRKVVEQEDVSGRAYRSVTSAVVDRLDQCSRASRAKGSSRAKLFDVSALLTDPSLVQRFDVHGRFRMAMRNLAAVDTAKAARELQAHVRSYGGYEHARVEPGAYATSWKAARASVFAHAARFDTVSVAVEATFIGSKLFMYEGERDTGWRVFGPEGLASVVRAVHKMVAATTPQSVAFALGPELTLLDVDVHDGFEVICPMRERHAGPHDDMLPVSSPSFGSFLSTDGRARLMELAAACETLAVDGVDSATAVRVSGRYVLINSHVLVGQADLRANGSPVRPVRMLSRDLWLARCDGADAAWPLRAPVLGEDVVLCYRWHDQLVFGGPVPLTMVGGDVITTKLDRCMQPGVSGAAVVAMSDFSLLGVYDGSSLYNGLVAGFTTEMFTDICTLDESEAGSRASLDLGDGLMGKMKKRGLGKYVACALDSMVPLFSGGVHVGMSCKVGDYLYVPGALASLELSVDSPGGPCVGFEPCDAGLARVRRPSGEVRGLVVRGPGFGEEVFAVGRDADGFFCSTQSGRVKHVGLAGKVFSIVGLETSPLPFAGGMIVSVRDGAVVGVYDNVVFDRDGSAAVVARAYPRRELQAAVAESPEVQLARVFPFLRPAAWPDGAASAVLSHASCGVASPHTMQAFAAIGDSVLRTALWERLFRSRSPTSGWQAAFQGLCSNAALARRCDELGLASSVRFVGLPAPASGAKVYADCVEAVVGAVHLYEQSDVARTLCGVILGVSGGGLGVSGLPGEVERAVCTDAG